MRISVKEEGGKGVIAVSRQAWCRPGADVLLLRMKELAVRGAASVVVDLGEIRLAGAAFLGALAVGAAEVERGGGRVVLTGVGRSVVRCLTATGLHQALLFEPDCRQETWQGDTGEEFWNGVVRPDAQTEGRLWSGMPGLIPATV